MFGDYGPYANYRGYELNAAHASGWAFLSPGASPHADLPPLKCYGHQLDFQGGAHAAMATLAAYMHRLKGGKGQAVDISEQECVAAMLEQNFVYYTYAGQQASRLGQRIIGPWFIADCADGKIFVFTVEEDQWKRLVEFMGNPEWAQEDLFKDRFARGQNNDALKALMTEWFSQWKVLDLYKRSTAAANSVCDDQYNGAALPERASARTQVLCAARATRRRDADAPGDALEVRQNQVVVAPARAAAGRTYQGSHA